MVRTTQTNLWPVCSTVGSWNYVMVVSVSVGVELGFAHPAMVEKQVFCYWNHGHAGYCSSQMSLVKVNGASPLAHRAISVLTMKFLLVLLRVGAY